jgi:DNA helicase-2/ATP-dependent DNA helicase PcrA
VPARGIGKTTLERAEALAAAENTTLLEALRATAEGADAGRSGARVRAFLELVAGLRDEVLALSPAEAIARTLDRTGYLRALEAQATPEAESRLENLRELLAGAEDFAVENATAPDEERSLLGFYLDQVALVSDLDAWEDRRDRVSMMSVHMAKGLEFPFVFLVGLEEGLLPHVASQRTQSALEEERRLCYVGMTRAMDRLHLTFATERRRFGSISYNPPSRFLSEIPDGVIENTASDRSTTRRAAWSDDSRAIDRTYAQDEACETDGVTRGMRLRHPIFGPGTVAEVRGIGASQKLIIRFDAVGVKTILVRFANLEPL